MDSEREKGMNIMKHMKKRILSGLLAGLVSVSSLAVLAPSSVSAAGLGYWPEPLPMGNQWYYQNESLQPYGSCFQIDELKNWSPDNDPDARYNRGSIPLRDRWMGPSVNPLASRDAKVMPLAMSNARASEAASQGGDGDFVYAFNNFQYVDTYNFWGGSSGEGPIAIPSPEHIDAAHRNGVPATGTIFIPWGDYTYGNRFVQELVEKKPDGTYPAADKLIEIAQYYGFDGYIFNAESGTGVPGFKDFLAYIQKNKPDNFTISWYNGSGSLSTGSIQNWMQDGDTRITDEWWLDMSGNGNVDGTIAAAQEMGVDPWNIHSTWEYWPMSGMSGTKGGDYHARLDKNGMLKISLGILAPTVTLTQSKNSDDFMNVQDQKLWVGPTFDPSSTYRPQSEFCGFASMVADKTPVIGTDFVTNFTTGNGYKFYENGKETGKKDGWYNRSLTDVLPTWRWIIESEGEKLSAKIDFDDAWWGGTSMKVYGNMDANKANHVKLYSSQLDITKDSKFSITYKAPKGGVDVELGLCFGNDYADENFKFYPIETTANGEWNTATFDLSGDAGKRAIAISLRFNAPEGVSDYSINVGRMAFTTTDAAPATVTDITLDEVIYPTDTTMEARIYWEKADNAFMYMIHRVLPDDTREFVGATPSDAFYLGKYDRLDNEAAATFEITPYTENGVKGSTTSFAIDWKDMPENSFFEVPPMGENLALGQPAVSSVTCVADGPVDKINDGVIPNSKWCSQRVPGYAVIDLGKEVDIQRWVVYHANARGAGEGVDMNTVAFDFSYAKDDGKPLLTGDDGASRARVQSMSFTQADRVTGNKQNVTDRNLSEPIKARYIKLNVTQSDNSPWHAIRVYEFQVYTNPGVLSVAAPSTPLARNVTVKNNEGATDTVVIDNVGMLYTTGTYASGGTISENTGVVKLYESMDAEEPIAQVKATQPDESYKQRSVGIAKFENLELNAEGGRLFYEILDESGGEILHSARYSVEYAPETGEAITEPKAELLGTVRGFQLRDRYGVLNLSGLPEGAEVTVYASEDADHPIRFSNPAGKDGKVSIDGVPLEAEGAGNVYYEVFVSGRPNSKRFSVSYESAMALQADLSGLNELIEKCSIYTEDECTTATWPAFEEALSEAKALSEADTQTAEAARAKLSEAYANLRKKADTQRLAEVAAELDEAHPATKYTETSYARFKAELDKCYALIKADDSNEFEVEQARIKLEAAMRGLVENTGATVTGVAVDPATITLDRGVTQKFTATVTGEGDPTQAVTWTLSGNQSDKTTIKADGTLKISVEETADTLTVTATSKLDEGKSATATVTVTDEVVAPNITVTVAPETLEVTADPGQKGQFTAIVEGAEDQTVVWTISGNTDENTLIENGQLFLGTDETASEMTVTATSVENPDCSGTAKVIVIRSNKEALQEAYDANKDRVEEEYTTETWAAFKAALDKAEEVLAKAAATQDEVDAAEAELERTALALVKRGNKLDLENLIAYAKAEQAKPEYQYVVPAVKKAFEEALSKAEEVMADIDASEADVQAAYDELLEKTWMLEYKGNKENLKDLYEFAEMLDLELYTSKTAEPVRAALEAAKAVLDNENALQADIDEAYNGLKAAVDGLTLKVNKDALGELIKGAEAIDLSKYLDSSKTDFAGALENAKAVYADDQATDKDVYDAYNRLQKAIFDLRLIPDKSLLEDLLNKASEMDESKYTAESFAVLKAAMEEALVVFNDTEATESDVKAAETKLSDAIEGLALKDGSTTDDGNADSPDTGDYTPLFGITIALAVIAGGALVLRRRLYNK